MGSIRRRLMTQRDSGNSGLPAGYYLCEYIEATGTQYIDTGFKHNQNTRVVMKAQMVGTPTSYSFLFDGPQADGQRKGILYYIDDKAWVVDYGLRSARQTLSAGMNDLLEIDYNKNVCTVNGETKTFTISSFQSTVNLALFCSNWNNIPQAFMTGRMYYCQIYDNGKKIRDYIPCVSPEGDFGLYDAVTKAFFKSASAVGFQGKIVIPEDYTWLEYIYSGGNAYIDTGFKPNQSTRVVMDAQLVNANDVSKTICFFGVRGNNTYYEIHKASTGNWKLTYLYGTNTNQAFTIDYSTRHYIDYNKNTATIDWGTSLTYTAQTFQMIYNLFLGADNGSGSATAMAPMRIFHSAIWDNGEIIRLFVPCINKSGVYGLYDRVNDKFYSSAGTGQFGEEPVVYDFAYTGGEQTVTLKPGTYKLECWGAQGGSFNSSVQGGKGSYISGVYKVENNTDVYINVGGQGQNNSTGTLNTGGYNGGGDGGQGTSVGLNGGGGGGATHIATSSGLLKAIDDSALIIVAGAGGGYGGPKQTAYSGGFGHSGQGASGDIINGHNGSGGYSGTSIYPGRGGMEGYGGEEDENDDSYFSGAGGGGGGGYIGGGGGGSGGIDGINPRDGFAGSNGSFGQGGSGGKGVSKEGWWAGDGGGGGGGSAFAASSLTSVSLIAGNATMPSITGGTETGHAGNGYARITKIA